MMTSRSGPVLVPLQFGADDFCSLAHAAAVCDAQASIILMHVVHSNPDGAADSHEPASRAEILRRYGEVFFPDRRIEVVVARGRPQDEIVRHARERRASLVILTSERGRGIWSCFRRATASRVIRALDCPILLLHPSACLELTIGADHLVFAEGGVAGLRSSHE